MSATLIDVVGLTKSFRDLRRGVVHAVDGDQVVRLVDFSLGVDRMLAERYSK